VETVESWSEGQTCHITQLNGGLLGQRCRQLAPDFMGYIEYIKLHISVLLGLICVISKYRKFFS